MSIIPNKRAQTHTLVMYRFPAYFMTRERANSSNKVQSFAQVA